jgi:hypothetical protein
LQSSTDDRSNNAAKERPESEVEVISSQPLVQQNKGESITAITQEFSINSSKEQGSMGGMSSTVPKFTSAGSTSQFSLSQAKGGFTSVVNV